jgi:hypothetical protein
MMAPAFPFTDGQGRSWLVYDFKTVERRRRGVPVGHWSAEARAFVPVDQQGPVLIYTFGAVAYHEFPPRAKMLENELRFARPLNATAADRMAGADRASTDH